MRTTAITILTTIILIVLAAPGAMGQHPVRFHNEQSDTTLINEMLIKLEKMNCKNNEALVAAAGRMLLGKPYVGGALEHDQEMLTINLDELDCTTFMESAAALAMTVASHRTSWRDYVYILEQLRYRNGRVDGYPSRLHYISDWIVDNSHRGNLIEVTDRIGNASHIVKTLDFMSSNRDLYPALKNDDDYERLKNYEIGYRSHRFPMIKPQNIRGASIKEGDIIAIVTNRKGLDVSHVGIAVEVDGEIHLMHASSKAKEVIVDPLPLTEYLRRNRQAMGIRVIRLMD